MSDNCIAATTIYMPLEQFLRKNRIKWAYFVSIESYLWTMKFGNPIILASITLDHLAGKHI